jgi:hypothetical protein
VREGDHRAIAGLTSTDVIDESVAQHAIKPGHERLIGQRLKPIEVADEGILQDVLGGFPTSEAPLEVPKERTMVLDENSAPLGERRVIGRVVDDVSHPGQYRDIVN